ncbi:MAG: xanthine dehydrogenase family protein molybdopterin-binding subunit [Spirochaetaceae bacterium]|jgi:CO/xanthine dehydrogenase Mo-binding subunit|nr:xanthine dehydrogenase family protein molybdopterin-binding subunit [Spirochaetaceae bacterium]
MFVDDIQLENPYYAFVLRSPAACGKLKSITAPPMEDGFILVKADDIPGENSLFDGQIRVLAKDNVCFTGEPVALLCGPALLKLEEYAANCVIEIEEETPEFSIEDAWEAGDFFARKEAEYGSVPKAKGELVVEGHYETGPQEHWYSEPHGAIAKIENGMVIIESAAQRPKELRKAVAAVLGINIDCVELKNAELGIHLDGKIWYPALIASLAALAAQISGRTVKLQLTREEDYLYSPKRTNSVVHIRSLLTFDGQILETDVLAKIGFGAAGVYASEIIEEITHSFLETYKTGKITIETIAIKTNVPPAGPFAGFGASLASFAMERHISKIADVLQEECVEWRKNHLRAKVKELDILSFAAKESDFRRKWAAYELLRGNLKKDERILPQRGIGLTFAAGSAARNNSLFESANVFPVAACVVEVEVDRVNYESTFRGIWLHIACGRPENISKAERVLRCATLAAISWSSIEKIKFIDGKITPPLCSFYEIMSVSATPEIHINFAYEEGALPTPLSCLEELPFCAVPAAFAQAISQAINYHVERIPIIGLDIWRILMMKRQENFDKKTEDEARQAQENG